MNERAASLVVAGALAACLIAGSTPRVVGDGGEYLAQAFNFAAGDGPPLGPGDIPAIERRVVEVSPELARWTIDGASVAGRGSRRDFLHFWFYALLATPALWVVNLVGASPLHAFTILNMALVGLALHVALPHIGRWAAVLLFAGPIVWWFDKAHTEVFTVALLTIAMVTMRDRPWWALVASAAAATQNPPIAVLTLLTGVVVLIERGRQAVTDRRLIAGGLAAALLLALPVTYTYVRHGTPSLLLAATRPGMPHVAELTASILDPSMGLAGNYPLFLAAVLVAAVWLAVRHPNAWRRPDAIAAVVSAAVFVLSFARTSNMHHGATPSLTRYALWLVPLSIPLWHTVFEHAGSRGRAWLATTAVVSALVSVFAFHPAVVSNSREPTWLAHWLWTAHPSWNDPLPEVFVETIVHTEHILVPVATAGCEKVLLGGSTVPRATWPVPCLPARLPAFCRMPDAYCYANRRGDGYTFTAAPGRNAPPEFRDDAAWPLQAEPVVEAIYAEWDWAGMVEAGPAAIDAFRANHDVRVAAFGTDERFLLVLRPTGPAPVVRFRPQTPLHGRMIDAVSGAVIATPTFDAAPGDLWSVAIPPGHDLVILALRHGVPDA